MLDVHLLPSIQDILSNSGKGKIWAKLDMMNLFFQTPIKPEHIKYTAVTTPFGLYEWIGDAARHVQHAEQVPVLHVYGATSSHWFYLSLIP